MRISSDAKKYKHGAAGSLLMRLSLSSRDASFVWGIIYWQVEVERQNALVGLRVDRHTNEYVSLLNPGVLAVGQSHLPNSFL